MFFNYCVTKFGNVQAHAKTYETAQEALENFEAAAVHFRSTYSSMGHDVIAHMGIAQTVERVEQVAPPKFQIVALVDMSATTNEAPSEAL